MQYHLKKLFILSGSVMIMAMPALVKADETGGQFPSPFHVGELQADPIVRELQSCMSADQAHLRSTMTSCYSSAIRSYSQITEQVQTIERQYLDPKTYALLQQTQRALLQQTQGALTHQNLEPNASPVTQPSLEDQKALLGSLQNILKLLFQYLPHLNLGGFKLPQGLF